MKKVAMVISSAALIGILIYNIPTMRIKLYEREVDSLAYTYRVYQSDVCPNRATLRDIRDEYLKTINSGNVNKLLWVNNKFDSRFMGTCLQSSPHRGNYQ